MPWISNCTASVILVFAPLLLRTLAAQAFEPGNHAAPGPRLFKRNSAGVYPGLRDRMADHRETGDDHVIADQQVPADRAGPADLAARADHGTAGNAGAARDRRVRAQPHVVPD